MRKFWLCVIVGALVPLSAFADVRINEIAWMGTGNSGERTDSNDEWIELYNDSTQAIDLTGWVLMAADGTPTINLKGILEAKSFFLLERSDDASVPGVKADLIFNGGMENSGEVLIVRDSRGIEIDRVDGGVNWKIVGGENETKKTAQLTSEGWITAVATPRALNTMPSQPEVASPLSVKDQPVIVPVSNLKEGNSEPALQVVATNGSESQTKMIWFLIGVAVLVLLGIVGSFLALKHEPKPAGVSVDDYTIIEEHDDHV